LKSKIRQRKTRGIKQDLDYLVILDRLLTNRTIDYLGFRSLYIPKKIKTIFIAESPPVSGTYFYNPCGRITEKLFSGLMKALFNKLPSTKEEGLFWFRDNGYLLIDSIYTPLNDIKNKSRRNNLIYENINTLSKDLNSLGAKKYKTKIILIKKNAYQVCYKELIEKGYNVINNNFIPFPSNGWQQKSINEIRNTIKSND